MPHTLFIELGEIYHLQMDADYVGEGSGEGAAEGRERRRRKQCSLDPTAIALEKEELSSRLKGELFSYREVEANDYGLSTEEVGEGEPAGRLGTVGEGEGD